MKGTIHRINSELFSLIKWYASLPLSKKKHFYFS